MHSSLATKPLSKDQHSTNQNNQFPHAFAMDVEETYITKSAISYLKAVSDGGEYYQQVSKKFESLTADSLLYQSQQEIANLQQSDDKSALAAMLAFRGYIFSRMDNYDTALHYLDEASQIFRDTGNSKSLAMVFDIIGQTHFSKGNYKQALPCLDSAGCIYQKIMNPWHVASVAYHRGLTYHALFDFPKAAEQLFIALDKFRQTHDPMMIWKSCDALGLIYLQVKDYQSAQHFFMDGFDIKKTAIRPEYKNTSKRAFASSYTNLANLFIHTGEPDTALAFLDKALEVWRSEKRTVNPKKLGRIYLLKSCAYKKNNDYDLTSVFLKKALNNFPGEDMPVVSYEIADLLHKQNRNQEALRVLMSVRQDAERSKDMVTRLKIHELFAEIFFQENRPEDAAFHYHQASEISRQLYAKEKLIALVKLKMAEDKKAFKNMLDADHQKLAARQNQITISRIALYTVIALLLGAILYIFKKRELAHKKRSSQDNKQKLITRLADDNSVEIIKANLIGKVDDKHINKLIDDLLLNDKKPFDKDFMMLYDKIDDNFYQKLSKKHPNLTQNDRVLCGLIKLGMSPKQIANITYHTPASIYVARNRLRKKLNIHNIRNLNNYIQDF